MFVCLFFIVMSFVCLFVVTHILPILASRTVDDGEASADEVVLHVHNDERRLRPNNLGGIFIKFVKISNLQITY